MKVIVGDGQVVDSVNGKTVLPPGPVDPDLESYLHWKKDSVKDIKTGTTATDPLLNRELGVKEVAELWGVSLPTARKTLQEMQAKHGPDVVQSRGNRLITTEAALAKLLPPRARQEMREILDEHANRIDELEQRVESLTAQIEAMLP